MHMERLEIKGFGRLHGLELQLVKGMNLIYGRNESGKSTLQAFIKAMLYGLKGGKPARDGLPAPLKRFRPWNGSAYGGVMEYSLESGLAFRVERDFERNTAELYDAHFNNITGEFLLGRDKLLSFAERQTGMNEICFEKTVFIKQLETSLDEAGAAALSSRLVNAGETGYEDVSLKKADKALKGALIRHVGTDRSSARPIDRLNARLAELEAAKASLGEAVNRLADARRELYAVRKSGEELDKRREYLEKVKKLIELRKKLEGHMAAESAIRDAAKRIRELEEKLENALKSSGTPAAAGKTPLRLRTSDIPAPAVLLAVSVLAALFGHEFFPYAYAASLFLLLAAAALLLSSIIRGRGRTGVKSGSTAGAEDERLQLIMGLKDRQKELYSKATLTCGMRIGSQPELRAAAAEAAKAVTACETALAEGLSTAGASYESMPGDPFNNGRLEEVIYDSGMEWLENSIHIEKEHTDSSLREAALKTRELETLLRNDRSDDAALQRIEEEEAGLKEKKAELERTGAALKLALEVLNDAGSEIKKNLTPALEKRMSAIAARMTGGRYGDVRVDEGLVLKTVSPETGSVSAARLLSGGAVDQLYLALRLAMADILAPSGESLPLFMDEVFSQYDDIRTGQTLEYLFEEYEGRQVLLFTCKEREAAIAGEICGSRLNLLKL